MEKIKWLSRGKIIVIIIGCFLLAAILFFLCSPHFIEKNFENVIEVPYQSKFSFASGSVCYGTFFSCKETDVKKEGDVDTSKVGDYVVTYTYAYHGKELTKEQKVEVVDDIPPTIEVEGENFTYCPNGKIPNYVVSATDNYDGDISDKVNVKANGDHLIFTVSDSSSNETEVIKDARKIDEEPPHITLMGEETLYIEKNSSYNEPGYTVSDNCDDDLTSKVVISGEVLTSVVGEYKITYEVSDAMGRSASVGRTVYVYENKSYDPPSGKSIYLTFDDGPSINTSKLLDVLKKYNVKATFFVTNQKTSYGYDDMIKRAYDEGHSIGLHSNSHVYSQVYSSVDNYFADLYAIQDKVKRITGYTSMIVRFPGGSSNTVSKNYDNGTHIMSKLSKSLEAKGFRYFDWNVLSGDAGETTSTAKVVSNVIGSLGSKDTYMVLQHDTQTFSVNAVEQIIQYGLSHGYTFRPITMDTPDVHHHINN